MPICFCASGCARNPLADPGVFGPSCSCFCHDAQETADEPADEERLHPLIDAIVERLDPDDRFGDVWDELDGRLLPEEIEMAAAGRCVEQTAHGMPWISYCEQAAAPRALLCARHRAEHIDQYGPLPHGNAFVGYRDDEDE